MIIAISGKKGHGKDLVAKIIQYLTSDYYKENEIFTDFIENEGVDSNSPWEVKRFADKLKDMVCMLLGCTREQLEDREFKEKELGEEWRIWSVWVSFSEGVEVFSSRVEAEKFHSEVWDDTGTHIKSSVLTPRKILQLLGTEAGRNIIHPNIWVNALMSEYKRPSYWEDRYYDEVNKKGFSGREEVWGDLPNWVISDMRFPNELEAVKKRKGITIRVNRPSVKSEDEHESETALDNATFDHVIVNDGTIEDLTEKVKQILIKEKILE